jgi:hypothetical protein
MIVIYFLKHYQLVGFCDVNAVCCQSGKNSLLILSRLASGFKGIKIYMGKYVGVSNT